MKPVVAAFNQEKALVGAFSVIVQLPPLISSSYKETFRMKLVEIPDSRTTSSTATYILADYPLRINLQPGAEVKQ